MKNKESLLSIFLTFLRFGLLAWGGPVAQISMIKEELVDKEKWITPQKFRRALAVYQALPGPEAHELCVYFGMVRAGKMGGFLAGLGFMLPGLLLMLALAWAYTIYGASILPLFIGVAPAVTAMIVRAAHRIGSTTLVDKSLWVAAFASVALTLLGVHFLFVFIICAVWQSLWSAKRSRSAIIISILLSLSSLAVTMFFPIDVIKTASHSNLLTEGFKAGLLSFGGAYTAIPFLQNSMVDIYPNITQQIFLHGVALGSVIPAPLIIFGTYLGFIADGLNGALLMTLGIFLPAFAFTLIGHNYLEKLIENSALHGALDGISAAVVGLLAITALDIFRHVITGTPQFILFIAALAALYLIKSKWAIPAVILSCGLLGQLLI